MIPNSPYKGLVPFEDSELDALLFFGRERESELIGANVLAARLTVLYGPSGVGKTSVLRAGVAHRLRAVARGNTEKHGHPEFAVVVFDKWSDDPVSGLLAAVRDELSDLFGSALLDEREGESLADTLARWTEALACDLLLVLDQAEEYFLYQAEEAGLADELPELVTRPGLRVRVLLSLRDDALSKLDRFKGSIPSLFGNYLRLDHLDRRSARAAIEGPIARYNELVPEEERVEFEPELVDGVLEETVAGRVDLGEAGRGLAPGETDERRVEAAYLQLVLERVWEEEREAGSKRLRAGTLERLGGAEAIVRAHLRRAVDALSGSEKDVAADVFRYLVTPSGTKIAHGVADLAEYASVEETRLSPVLATLGRERIVRTVDGAGANGARYEIFHDVLAEAVLAWRRERELDRERRAAQRRHRRLLVLTAGALVALAAMAAVAVYALAQRSDARKSARSARARELTALAQSLLPVDPLRSVGLARRAAELEPNPTAEDVLRTSLLESRVRKVLRAGRGPVNAAAYSPDGSRLVTASDDGYARVFGTNNGKLLAELRHGGSVTDAAFSADGSRLVTASRDGTARLWTTAGRPLRTLEHAAPVLGFALSRDASVLVTIAGDATVHVWRLTGAGGEQVFHEPKAPSRVVISADGRFAATGGGDRFARVYDLLSGSLLYTLPHDGTVLSLAFGPRKEMLATGSADWSARTWDLRRGRLAYRLAGHEGRVADVAVSPRGQFVATASADGTARVWNIATAHGALVAVLMGHTNLVNDITFSRDGLFVVTSSRDGTARIWKSTHGNPQGVLAGHAGSVRGASFSPSGSSVLTYGEDGTARIWDSGIEPELQVLSRQSKPIGSLDVSPDGRRLVTAGADGRVRIWTKAGRRVAVIRDPGARAARFSPDGRLLATGGAEAVRIWTIGGEIRRTLRDSTGVVAVAFSPGGDRLAAAGPGRIVRIWSVGDGRLVRRLETPRGSVVALAFSPDGSRLATAGTDRVARLWQLSSGRLEHTLQGHHGALTSVAFSPDGRLLATASVDHDARLWDARRGTSRRVLRGHFAIVSDARFSADGRWLVTAGPGTAGLWEVRSGRLLSLLRGHRGILRAAAFAPGGHTLFTAGEDGTLRTYVCQVCGRLPDLLALADRRLRVARAAS